MNYTAVEHPDRLKEGVRLIMRVWRNKEKQEGRRAGRTLISHDVASWNRMTAELLAECVPGERVYASADARDTEKAIRVFKERQLAADYDAIDVRHAFYNQCFTRWLSCLGAPQAAAETHFLFDCDDAPAYLALSAEMVQKGLVENVIHTYKTKNGQHVLTRPFNPMLLSDAPRSTMQKNPLLLVGWMQDQLETGAGFEPATSSL